MEDSLYIPQGVFYIENCFKLQAHEIPVQMAPRGMKVVSSMRMIFRFNHSLSKHFPVSEHSLLKVIVAQSAKVAKNIDYTK